MPRAISGNSMVCRSIASAVVFTAALLFVASTVHAQDLIIRDIDASGLTGDTQTLLYSGTVEAVIENLGAPTGGPFSYTFFEDLNGNGEWDPGDDNELATAEIPAPGAVSVLVSSTLQFAGSLIYGMADSNDDIVETDEDNNVSNSGLACEFEPPEAVFDPQLEWSWTSSSVESNALNVMMTPVVIDLDGDDIPEVVFGSTPSTGGGLVEVGFLRALKGSDGSELFTVTNPNLRISTSCSIAAGDIDLDGRPEIIACDSSGSRLIVFEHDGTFKWRSVVLEAINWGAPSIADIDEDGNPEIIIGRQVLDNNGLVLWTGAGGRASQGTVGPISVVADVDLDGDPEVVAGNTIYSNAGGIEATGPYGDGHNAIADFDDDDFPEIVLVQGGVVWLLEHDMTLKWGPVAIPGGGAGGPPTIADYDDDGEPEIGVAGASRYAVFDTDGSLIWAAVTQDGSSNRTGSSVFDFDGDGSAEVVYRDERFLRVYRGTDGFVLFQVAMSSCTWHEYVLVADVDADGNAEIVAVANNNCGFGPQRGVYVYGSASDSWVATRTIWNQHSYHITNVNGDGSIPVEEENSWQFPPGSPFNSYRQNVLTSGSGSQLSAPDLTASLLGLECDVDRSALTARIGNGGSVLVGTGIPVSFYEGDPDGGGTLLGTTATTTVLDPGEFEDVVLFVGGFFEPTDTIYAVADDAGGGVSTENECDETNNAASAALGCEECQDADLVLVDFDTVSWDPVTLIWEVTVRIRNNGPGTAFDVNSMLIEEIPWVTPIDDLSSYGDIAPGETKSGDSYVLDLTGRPGPGGFSVFFNVAYLNNCGDRLSVVLDPPATVPGESGQGVPSRFVLSQNQPNPFNPSTTISFELGDPGHVRLDVFDAQGRLVATLVDRSLAARQHTVRWDGRDSSGSTVGSGLYYYRLKAGEYELTRKMTLLK